MSRGSRTALRWVGYAAIFAVTLEVSARVDDMLTWGAPFRGRYSHEALARSDSIVVRGHEGFRYEKWQMNAQGFRGPELRRDRAGVTRIAVLGASETFGLFEDEGQEYPAQMQRMLDSLAPGRFEVVNVALAGLGINAMLPYYERIVAPHTPDIVVTYLSPSFYLEPNPPPAQYTAWRYPARRPGLPGLVADLTPELRSAAKAKTVLKAFIPAPLQRFTRERKLEQRRAGQPAEWFWTAVPADRMDMFEQQADRLIGEIDSTGAEVFVVTHANRFLHRSTPMTADDSLHMLTSLSSLFPRATPEIVAGVDSSANARLRRVATRHGARIVEAERAIPADGVHYGDYLHFTNDGARVMARLIVDALLAPRDAGRDRVAVAP